MNHHGTSIMDSRALAIFILFGLLLMTGCGSGENTQQAEPAASAQEQSNSAAKTPFVPLDACTLLSKADVETITGKTVLDPAKQEMANLSTCSYGDPESPKLPNGHVLSNVLTVSVFTGEEGAYYAGPVAQAKDIFETARKNAASPQKVAGLGEDAYWDSTLHTLHVYLSKYQLEFDVDPEKGLDLARAVAEKAITKLP